MQKLSHRVEFSPSISLADNLPQIFHRSQHSYNVQCCSLSAKNLHIVISEFCAMGVVCFVFWVLCVLCFRCCVFCVLGVLCFGCCVFCVLGVVCFVF